MMRRHHGVLASSVVALVLSINACGHLAPSYSHDSAALGRWLFTFDIMGGLFRTPVELTVDSAGLLRAYALGPPVVRFTAANISNQRLQLEGQSRYGGVHLSGAIVADSFEGRWRIKILRGHVSAHRQLVAASTAIQRIALFDAVRDSLSRRYYDSTFGGNNWDSVAALYRPRVASARNDGEWLAIVRQMLGGLHSSHLDLSAISLAEAFPTRGGDGSDEAKVISWRKINRRIAYLRIARFDEGPAALARLDRALSQIHASPAVVIDVRGNPGGTLGVAMRLGDYLLPRSTPVGTFRARRPSGPPGTYAGYKVDDFLKLLHERGAVTIVTGGRAPNPYVGRVALLVDEQCGSTTEAFAAVLQELHRATLVGQRTAGGMLSSAELPLERGWILRFPEADFFTPGGRRIEGRGVTPDVVASRNRFRDGQLNAAVSLLSLRR